MSSRGQIYGGQPERERKYVGVVSLTTSDGLVSPLEIRWDDGRRFRIDRILDRRQAQSLKTGGTGMRYTVRVGGRDTRLFYDDYRRAWFVEAKRVTSTTGWGC